MSQHRNYNPSNGGGERSPNRNYGSGNNRFSGSGGDRQQFNQNQIQNLRINNSGYVAPAQQNCRGSGSGANPVSNATLQALPSAPLPTGPASLMTANMPPVPQSRTGGASANASSIALLNSMRRNNFATNSSGNPNHPAGRDIGLTAYYGIIINIKEDFGFIQPLNNTGLKSALTPNAPNSSSSYVPLNENIYFSLRELTSPIKYGDEVRFNVQKSNKGYMAHNIVNLPKKQRAVVEKVIGIIKNEEDMNRCVSGSIEVKVEALNVAMKRNVESSGAGTGTTIRIPYANESSRGCKFIKEDEVSFCLHYEEEASESEFFCRATNLRLHRTKKDRLMQEQVQHMIAMGVKVQQGIVSSLKPKGGYGFIQSADKMEEIFFRFDDVVLNKDGNDPNEVAVDHSNTNGKSHSDIIAGLVEEGTELEYLTILESNGGKMSNRGVHLKILPKGTIVMELVLRTQVQAMVTNVPCNSTGSSGKEKPGYARLLDATEENAYPEDSVQCVSKYKDKIELWPRCMSESLIQNIRVGDVLTLSVHYYRPQKMYFARDMSVYSYRKVGREYGIVCKVLPKEQNYGFICPIGGLNNLYSSNSDDINHFFRCSEVLPLSKKSKKVDNDMAVNTPVSYDVVIETISQVNKGGNVLSIPKYRAIRVEVETPATMASRITTPLSGTGTVVTTYKGRVGKEARRDSPGTVKITECLTAGSSAPAHVPFPATVLESLDEFMMTKEPQVSVQNITPISRYHYYRVLQYYYSHERDFQKYHGVCLETLNAIPSKNSTASSTVKGYYKVLRIYRASSDDEYHAWAMKYLGVPKRNSNSNAKGIRIMSRLKNAEVAVTNASAATPIPALTVEFDADLDLEVASRAPQLSKQYNGPTVPSVGSNIHYLLTDPTAALYGSMLKGLEIEFELAFDHTIQSFVAYSMRVPQTELGEGSECMEGVIQSVINTGSRGSGGSNSKSTSSSGYIRVITTDEKLYWIHTPSVDAAPLSEGMLVTFRLVLLGGLRCATAIVPKKTDANHAGCFALVQSNAGVVARCIGVVLNKLELRSATGTTSTTVASRVTSGKSKATSALIPANNVATQYVVLIDTNQCCDAFKAKYEDSPSCLVHALRHSMGKSVPCGVNTENSVSNSDWNTGTSLGPESNKPQYFNSLFRQPVPILTLTTPPVDTITGQNADGETGTVGLKPTLSPYATQIISDIFDSKSRPTWNNDKCSYEVGALVECSVVVNTTLQRSPIGVCNLQLRVDSNQGVESVEKPMGGVYVNGRVAEARIKIPRNVSTADASIPTFQDQEPIEYIHLNIESELSNTPKAIIDGIQAQSESLMKMAVPTCSNINELVEIENSIQNSTEKEIKKLRYSFYCDVREMLYDAQGKSNPMNVSSHHAYASSYTSVSGNGLSKGDIVRFMIVPNANGMLGHALYPHMVIGATIENRLSSGSGAKDSHGLDIITKRKDKTASTGTMGSGTGTGSGSGTAVGGVNNITMAKVRYYSS